jgi:hypothetical protein
MFIVVGQSDISVTRKNRDWYGWFYSSFDTFFNV